MFGSFYLLIYLYEIQTFKALGLFLCFANWL